MAVAGRHDGKVAVLTGSTSGIGFAIARRLGQEGCHLVIGSRQQSNVDEAVKKLKEENISVVGQVCHQGKKEDRERLVKTAVETFGGIDILVPCAGVNPATMPFLQTTDSVWDKIFEINVKSVFMMCSLVVEHMKKRGKGNIILLGSIGGFMSSESFKVQDLGAQVGVYFLSKQTLFGLTKLLCYHCASFNIRVNCVAPGGTYTTFGAPLISDPKLGEVHLQAIPLKRFAELEDSAGLVSFLVSDDARYITGENIMISGGMVSRL